MDSRNGRRIAASNNNNEPIAGFKSPCGTSNEVSHRLGLCLTELFELIEGRFGVPQTDADQLGHCDRFNATEKCARVVAKDCLQGLHKTAVGAVASATRRFRQKECKTEALRTRYREPLKCAIRRGPEMKALYANNTGMLQGIRDLSIAPEEKLVKMCCLLNRLDGEIEKIFNKDCPQSTPLVIGIVHAMTDDARNTLCRNPKCDHALDNVLGHKYKPTQNFIEPIMQILFQLNVN